MREREGHMDRKNEKGRVEQGSLKLSRNPAAWLLYDIRATSTESSGVPSICVSIHTNAERLYFIQHWSTHMDLFSELCCQLYCTFSTWTCQMSAITPVLFL